MALDTMLYTGTLTIIECGECHIQFAIPSDMQRRALANHSIPFYCPRGDRLYYQGKTAEEKAKEDAAAARAEASRARASRDAAYDQALAAHRSAAAHKGQVTRIRNLIAKGICPCCRRNFSNLRDHMATEHPNYAVTQQSFESPDSKEEGSA